MKSSFRFSILLLFVSVLLFILIISTPDQLDFTPSYHPAEKIPLGTYALRTAAPQLFPAGVYDTAVSFKHLVGSSSKPDSLMAMFIITDVYKPDSAETSNMLSWVEKGNILFIAARTCNFQSDSLPVHAMVAALFEKERKTHLYDSVFTHNNSFTFLNIGVAHSFDTLSDLSYEMLGGYLQPDFIRVYYGSGTIYVNLLPQIFANISFTDSLNTYHYACNALSYLPQNRKLLWNTRFTESRGGSGSPIRYILQQPPLAWAYYLGLTAFICFAIFTARRKQRIIPVIKPLKNNTVDFVRDISRLFFIKKDNKSLAENRIIYFYEYLRERYHLTKDRTQPEYPDYLAKKTGKSKEEVLEFLALQNEIQAADTVSDELLKKLNRIIESYS